MGRKTGGDPVQRAAASGTKVGLLAVWSPHRNRHDLPRPSLRRCCAAGVSRLLRRLVSVSDGLRGLAYGTLLLATATLGGAPIAGLEAQAGGDLDRFQLFTSCAPVVPSVIPPTDAWRHHWENIGLREDAVRRAVTSRLRSARIYSEEFRGSLLSIEVGISNRAFHLDVKFHKLLRDAYTDIDGFAVTWSNGLTSILGASAASQILGHLSQLMDRFIDDYLRVNAEAC